MIIRTFLIVAVMGLGLGGCADVGLPEPGFVTTMFAGDDDADSHRCTSDACSPAPGFCVARGYTPNTPRYDLCIRSVNENLRKEGKF